MLSTLPQVAQLHHCLSVQVPQNEHRHVGGGTGVAVWAVSEALLLEVLGRLPVRSITTGLGRFADLSAMPLAFSDLPGFAVPQASQERKCDALCKVHTPHVHPRDGPGDAGRIAGFDVSGISGLATVDDGPAGPLCCCCWT